MNPNVTGFFHEPSKTVSHVVADPDGGHAAVIDPVMDYDAASGQLGTTAADRVVAHVRERGLTVDWILETHAHADHLSAAPYVRAQVGGRIGIGEHIRDIQDLWCRVFNTPGIPADGSPFDRLFVDGETFRIGGLEARVMHTPGHTAADVTYLVGDAAFVGDTLFMPDYGTARADFPGGDARTLYGSIRRILALPEATRLFVGHDYLPPGRSEYQWETTVAEQRARNVHVHEGVSEEAFVAMRTARDETLPVPQLLYPSLQVNIRGGKLPEPEPNGDIYFKIPVRPPERA